MVAQVIAGAFAGSVVSGFVPLVNGEAVAIVASLAVQAWARPLLLLVCVLGQITAKLCVYWLARECPERLPARARALVARFDATRTPTASTLVVFSSSLITLPPLYATTLAAGVLGVPVTRFVLGAVPGMTLRFGALIWGAGYFVG